MTASARAPRSAAEQAEIEAEMDAMFSELGVDRGESLMSALKPSLIVPMPEPTLAVQQPTEELASAAAAKVTASTAATDPADATASIQ